MNVTLLWARCNIGYHIREEEDLGNGERKCDAAIWRVN